MKILNAIDFPLKGHQLIEASAGTGKTYTITNLYLRLLLGHSQALNRPLAVNEILVLTFTVAATDELRQRIRDRIYAARECLASSHASTDSFLQFLLEHSQDRHREVKLLNSALQLMDEAAIYTIHGFCNKILTDQSLATRTLFDQRLDADINQLLQMAAEDCFRAEILTLPPLSRDVALDLWPTPELLLQKTRGFLARHNLVIRPEAQDIGLQLQQLETKLAWVRQRWQAENYSGYIQSAAIKKNTKSYTRLPHIEQFLRGTGLFTDDLQYFTPAGLSANLKKGSELLEHPLMPLLQEVQDLQWLKEQLRYNLWHSAIGVLQRNLNHYKAEFNQLTMDDLLTGVHQALHDGTIGDQLAQQLARQWPVAMVDEFQDTDDIQYGIFSKIYYSPGPQSLLLIGDPKQAIYKFRGADIYTYINAKRRLNPEHDMFSLQTNWRSTGALVAAVNHLFDQPNVFDNDQDMAFLPVISYPNADEKQMRVGANSVKPVSIFALTDASGGGLKKPDARFLAMECAAQRTAELLSGGATINNQPVHAGRIAFLVRQHKDMLAAREALARRNIRSVYVTQESVFLSSTADDLVLFLQAVSEPGNEAGIRTALATRLLQTPVSAIIDLDETNQQQKLLEEFRTYHDIWATLGVAAMLDSLICQRSLAHKWFGQLDGERQITNLRHLAELLQTRASIAPGLHRLIKWFQRERQLANSKQEERQLRLESDQNLVQIVTMHAAKGLEYDIVMIPLAAFGADPRNVTPPLLLHEATASDSFTTLLELRHLDEFKRQAQRENLTEEMRLLYVALTRARYQCHLGFPLYGALSRGGETALGKLLGVSEPKVELDNLTQRINQLPKALFDFQVVSQVPVVPMSFSRDQMNLTPPPIAPSIYDPWRVHSFTGLAHALQASNSDGSSPYSPNGYLDDDPVNREETTAVGRGQLLDQFSFPGGRKIGIGLHSLLEQLDFKASDALKATAIERCISRLGFVSDKEELATALVNWLEHILNTPLLDETRLQHPSEQFCLRDLRREDCLNELEFHFPVSTDAEFINTLVTAGYLAPGVVLARNQIRGIMTGHIDLVVRHQNRYYVMDYKSNYLGNNLAAYATDALQQAMQQHSYELQYLIYTVALHRYLGQRVFDYSYDRHFGGICYLFLRGMHKDQANSGVFFARPSLALIQQLDSILRGRS
jgi:exodeoxyribonuclease V beta subunit